MSTPPSVSPALLEAGPLVIGATGGSGTSVVATVLRRAGLFTGVDLNESEDAWRFGDNSDRWINKYLAHDGSLPAEVDAAMADDLDELLARHCAPIETEPRPWGWKEPRSIYLLRFFHRHLPALRFLHVVRDGRDMALSENQNQLRKHGDAASIPANLPPAVRSIALWSWVNIEAARSGETLLRDRYLRIRFEDLCQSPEETASRISDFVGIGLDADAVQTAVSTPVSLGRWRSEAPSLIATLEQVGAPGLARFGYDLSTPG